MPFDCKHRSAPNTHRHAVDWATAWSGTRAETYNVQATSRIAGARRPRGSRRTRRRRTCRAPGNRTTHDNAHGVESRSNRSVDAQPHGTQRLSTMKLGVAGIRDSDGGGGCWVKLPTSVNLYVAHAASLVMFPPVCIPSASGDEVKSGQGHHHPVWSSTPYAWYSSMHAWYTARALDKAKRCDSKPADLGGKVVHAG